jgi:hypothetical protein
VVEPEVVELVVLVPVVPVMPVPDVPAVSVVDVPLVLMVSVLIVLVLMVPEAAVSVDEVVVVLLIAVSVVVPVSVFAFSAGLQAEANVSSPRTDRIARVFFMFFLADEFGFGVVEVGALTSLVACPHLLAPVLTANRSRGKPDMRKGAGLSLLG